MLVAVVVGTWALRDAPGVASTPPADPSPAASTDASADRPPASIDALLPEGHHERGRHSLVGDPTGSLVLSHPSESPYVTVSVFVLDDGLLTLVDRRELRCSVDEGSTAAGGATMVAGDAGAALVSCLGYLDTNIDPDTPLPTRLWAVDGLPTGLVVHPDAEQGWPTVGFRLASAPDGSTELVLPQCTDRNCAEDEYSHALHIARDAPGGTYAAVACSDLDGQRTEMPGGPWDVSSNPELLAPSPGQTCG